MKWLFIFLLLGNVVYLGWELDRETSMRVSRQSSLPRIPADADRLRLVQELQSLPPLRDSEVVSVPAAPVAAETTTPAGTPVAEDIAGDVNAGEGADEPLDGFTVSGGVDSYATSACFSFGPVADEAQAMSLRDWLVGVGGSSQVRHTDEQGRQLFWVYLAPQESRQEAMTTIRSFREKGVQDFRLIVTGNLQNAISMGLFSSQSAVNKRLNELEKKGYKPVVVPYSDGKRVYWIDARLREDAALPGIMSGEFPSRFSSSPVECAEIAIAPDNS